MLTSSVPFISVPFVLFFHQLYTRGRAVADKLWIILADITRIRLAHEPIDEHSDCVTKQKDICVILWPMSPKQHNPQHKQLVRNTPNSQCPPTQAALVIHSFILERSAKVWFQLVGIISRSHLNIEEAHAYTRITFKGSNHIKNRQSVYLRTTQHNRSFTAPYYNWMRYIYCCKNVHFHNNSTHIPSVNNHHFNAKDIWTTAYRYRITCP